MPLWRVEESLIIFCLLKVVKGYDKPKGKPRCTLEVDIMKAFDYVKWKFIVNILEALDFPSIFIS